MIKFLVYTPCLGNLLLINYGTYLLYRLYNPLNPSVF